MKNFCKNLKEHTTNIIKSEKLKMWPLIEEENKLHEKQKLCCIYV